MAALIERLGHSRDLWAAKMRQAISGSTTKTYGVLKLNRKLSPPAGLALNAAIAATFGYFSFPILFSWYFGVIDWLREPQYIGTLVDALILNGPFLAFAALFFIVGEVFWGILFVFAWSFMTLFAWLGWKNWPVFCLAGATGSLLPGYLFSSFFHPNSLQDFERDLPPLLTSGLLTGLAAFILQRSRDRSLAGEAHSGSAQ